MLTRLSILYGILNKSYDDIKSLVEDWIAVKKRFASFEY